MHNVGPTQKQTEKQRITIALVVPTLLSSFIVLASKPNHSDNWRYSNADLQKEKKSTK